MKALFPTKSRLAISAAAAAACIAFAAPAHATINAPVPANAYITYSGLNWAWGGPCPYSGGCGNGDLTYQSTQGWRLPSAAEMAIVDALDAGNPATFANLFYGSSGNVPSGGSDPLTGSYFNGGEGGSCASPWFSVNYVHCDSTDANVGAWNGSILGANYAGSGNYYDEQLYVRAAVRGGVPEPATWAMMLAGFGMIGFAIRRRRQQPKAQTGARYAF